MPNLREREIVAISKMLTLSKSSQHTGGGITDFNDQWKVLIYDAECRDVISPLMNVASLRRKGVTLHLLLHSEREPVPDAPAVYFVRPTEANINKIAEDCSKQLYRTAYVNFITRVERPLMEKLAQELVATNSVPMISKVFDQYLDVIALEPSLFTLNIRNSFLAYNVPSLSEAQIRSFMNRTAVGLLSMVRVLGSLPIIRSPTGGAAEMLANELCTMLRDNVSSRSGAAQSLFEDCLVSEHNRPRPLLLILDRTADLFPVLQHTSTYQALVHDLLDYQLNRVNLDVEERDGVPGKKKSYDLNTQSDPFLSQYAGVPFPEAIEANEKELAEVSQRESAIRNPPPGTTDSIEGKGKDLSEAIESLPEILAKKMNLEAHTNILHAVMKRIASREVPTFFELEQSILNSGGRISDSHSAIVALLKDGTKGLLEDKARLLALLAVSGDPYATEKASSEKFDEAFKTGCQAMPEVPTQAAIDSAIAGVEFLRRLQSLQSSSLQGRMGRLSAAQPSNAILSTLLTSATSRASSFMAKAASFFTKFTPFYATRIVDNLAEGRACIEDESFCYLDPRLRDGRQATAIPPSSGQSAHGKYSDVIVFFIGGGCYSEFYNLQQLLKDKATSGQSLRNVMYGCTELLTGGDFLTQVEELGTPSAPSPPPPP